MKLFTIETLVLILADCKGPREAQKVFDYVIANHAAYTQQYGSFVLLALQQAHHCNHHD